MIPVHKLLRLPPGQRRRKIALVLTSIERSGLFDLLYVTSLVRLALEDPKLPAGPRETINRILDSITAEAGTLDSLENIQRVSAERVRVLCNHTRHALLTAIGTFPAEWDLIAVGHDQERLTNSRFFFPGVCIYAEDLRSPFNIGSVFRTAEAFGVERVYVSPDCVSPEHPRAIRSAMGSVSYLPWERSSLENLPSDQPVFALETGGIPIEDFDFPAKGIVIIGSEELGVSPEALERATAGRVSIPMYGIKASLNVSVATGIVIQQWTAYLSCSASKPF